MNDWHNDGAAAHELQLLHQQWLEDEAAQREYQQYLDQLTQEEKEHEMER